ncbi:MFS transporter [Mucilaginibacter daejeonensis]|uniref:MFS transporter n=1 Tax=Mucilaginibacter daejeonensis TaxID=398049 RepID=UPI001D175EFB|nr:MFS transporter [Mucilaginibacter daejeonensis]UEG54092.1 MFS transporter [Mucilaginibacter daejeonensis]
MSDIAVPHSSSGKSNSFRSSLEALNFFMADMQAGIGPFLGIFLLAHQWKSGPIGTVMTLGGVAGVLVTIPAGALIDRTRHKKLFVIIPGICTVLASAVILLSQEFWVVALSQVATAIAGAAIVPAVMAITLGLVCQKGFNRQNGRNQAWNHAGNMVGAGLSGFLGMKYGMTAIFYLSAVFGLISIFLVSTIPASAIDDRAARGMKEGDEEAGASNFKALFECKPLLLLAAALAAFHLGNGAMLPLYGLGAASQSNGGNASMFVAMTIVIAQLVMIGASVVAMRAADKSGYWLIMLLSFIALPVRGIAAVLLNYHTGIYPVQALDGIGAGLQSVAVPALVAHILNGTGRINVGQGAVMTVQGVGAALSPAIGGWLAQGMGFKPAFLVLGSFAVVSILIWIFYSRTLRAVCDPSQEPKHE